jgi:hypothetical protein
LVVGLLFAAMAAAYVVFRGTSSPIASDFDQLWYGARAAWRGVSPYSVVGPGREFEWDYLFYPMPAVVLAMPLALMPLLAARAVLAGTSAFLLSFALWREDRGRLLLFASAPTLIALGRGQASPLLLAAAFIPALSWLGTIKPNIAIALLPASRNLRTTMVAGVIGTVILLGISFAIEPTWLSQWRDAVSHKNDSAPIILRFAGFLVLIALVRWRRRDAWLVLLLACLPQTPSLYDAVPLFAVPRGARETAILALGGNLAFLALVSGIGFPAATAYGVRVTTLSLVFMYLPTVVLLLIQPATDRSQAERVPRASRGDWGLFLALAMTAFFAFLGTVAKYRP